jgi:16S rRNA (guanine966-N2)-methyltransferase
MTMLKIIAGEFRSRILQSPEDDSLSRPYSSRVRESVFNLLRGWCEGATVLDLFAGVGTIGLEAISRGAARVYMIERNREIYDLLKQNIATLGCGERAIPIHADALGSAALARVSEPVDLAFVDPPYETMEQEPTRCRVLDQIVRVRALMGDKGFVVLRSPLSAKDVDLSVPGLIGPEQHQYGRDMNVLLYAPAPRSDNERSDD